MNIFNTFPFQAKVIAIWMPEEEWAKGVKGLIEKVESKLVEDAPLIEVTPNEAPT